MSSEERRNVGLSPVVKGHLYRRETSDVVFRPDLNLGQQAACESLLSCKRQGFLGKHVLELLKPWVLKSLSEHLHPAFL